MTSHICNIDVEYYSTDDKNKFLIVKTIEDNEDHQQNHYIIQTLRIYKEKLTENPEDGTIGAADLLMATSKNPQQSHKHDHEPGHKGPPRADAHDHAEENLMTESSHHFNEF